MDGEPEASEGEWGGRNGRHRENVDEHHRVIHIHLHRLEFKWKSLLSTTNFRTHERGFLVSTNLLGGPLPKLVPGRTRTGVVPQSHIGLYYVLKRTCPGGFGLAHGRRPSLVVDKRKTIICNDRLERLPHRHQTHLHRWWWWVSFRGGRVIVSPPSPASSTAHVCCFQSKQWLPLIWMNDKCISSHQTNWTHRHHRFSASLHFILNNQGLYNVQPDPLKLPPPLRLIRMHRSVQLLFLQLPLFRLFANSSRRIPTIVISNRHSRWHSISVSSKFCSLKIHLRRRRRIRPRGTELWVNGECMWTMKRPQYRRFDGGQELTGTMGTIIGSEH